MICKVRKKFSVDQWFKSLTFALIVNKFTTANLKRIFKCLLNQVYQAKGVGG